MQAIDAYLDPVDIVAAVALPVVRYGTKKSVHWTHPLEGLVSSMATRHLNNYTGNYIPSEADPLLSGALVGAARMAYKPKDNFVSSFEEVAVANLIAKAFAGPAAKGFAGVGIPVTR